MFIYFCITFASTIFSTIFYFLTLNMGTLIKLVFKVKATETGTLGLYSNNSALPSTETSFKS